MTATELKNELAIGFTDYQFSINGKHGTICPFNRNENFFAVINYDGTCEEYHHIDDLMTAPFLDGKSLSEVAEEIDLYG